MGIVEKKYCSVCGELVNPALIATGLNQMKMPMKCAECGDLCHAGCLSYMANQNEYKNGNASNIRLCKKCFARKLESLPQNIVCAECGDNLFVGEVANCDVCDRIYHANCMVNNAVKLNDIKEVLHPFIIDLELPTIGDLSFGSKFWHVCAECSNILIDKADIVVSRFVPLIVPINKPCKFRNDDIIMKINSVRCKTEAFAEEMLLILAMQLDGNAIVDFTIEKENNACIASGLVLKTDLEELVNVQGSINANQIAEIIMKMKESEKADEQQKNIENEIDTNKIYFYKDGDRWLVGSSGRIEAFSHTLGFSYIHFLLANYSEDTYFSPLEVQGFAKVDIRTILDKDKFDKYDKDNFLYSLLRDKSMKKIDGVAVKQLLKRKEELADMLSETDNAEEKMIIEEEREQVKKALNQKDQWIRTREFDNARLNVRDAISLAIGKIADRETENVRITGIKPPFPVALHLDRHIERKDVCRYKPTPSEHPEWILFSSELGD